MSLSFTELVIYHHELLQHPTYIIRPFLLYLAQNGGDSFLCRVDFGSYDAVPFQILNYSRQFPKVFPEEHAVIGML